MSAAIESALPEIDSPTLRRAPTLAETLLPWRNPVFRRFFRGRLRFRKAIFWYLLTLIVTTFVVSLGYTLQINGSQPPQTAARNLWISLLVIQGLILMVKGTGAVSAGLIQDRIDRTLDYQRLTPVSPLGNLVGYLFGLPVLEYAMFALTLPHLAFIAVIGNIPTGTLVSVYCAFFVCVVLYHTMGIAAGMVMRRWVLGNMLSMLLVLFVNLLLPSLVSRLGLGFFQYLSVWPVIGQKVLPVVGVTPSPGGNPFLSIFSDVPFYVWSFSPFTFTLLLQGALILTFGVMAVRRWKSSTRHSLSKPYALAFLAGFVVLAIGNVWPFVTRAEPPPLPFPMQNTETAVALVVGGLSYVYAYVVWILCLLLFAIIVPSHQHYVRGIRRALKHGRSSAGRWEDDSASLAVYAIFAAVAVGGLAILLREVSAAGFFETLGEPIRSWRLSLTFALVLFYSALLFQTLGLRRSVLVVLLVWWVPILAMIVLAATTESFGKLHAAVQSLSPLALLFMSGVAKPAPGSEVIDEERAALALGADIGLAVLLIQTAALWIKWRRHVASYDALCRSQSELERVPTPSGNAPLPA